MLNNSALNILLLDDDLFMIKLLTHMLNKQGFDQVMGCHSGHAAKAHLEHNTELPDLVILDINMPEMDGVEFIRELVKLGYKGSLILLSGEDERVRQSTEKLAEAHGLKVLGGLAKPVKPAVLNELVQQWLPPAAARKQQTKKNYSADELRAAIANGELVNYYQPKVSVTTGQVIGVEALVRWDHPDDGMVFPDQFIHIAETHKLIDELTRVVVQSALQQVGIWASQGLALTVAINVSMDNLVALEFADIAEAQASAAGVAAQNVVLEVTESRLTNDIKNPLDILTRLRLKRFVLAIDDFGTGHSSMTQLSNLPFDQLKIDRAFVHGACNNETVRAIYEASIKLAKKLGMESVAEGVEDLEDWNFLYETGCDVAQGYFIAKPMPAADMLDWVGLWNSRYHELTATETV